MSVHEEVSSLTSSSVSNGGIPRSKSFTGVINHKRSSSSNSAEGCGVPESEVGVRTTWGPATLGQNLQLPHSPRLFRRHLSFGAQQKVSKTPRPARTTLMFEKVSLGLRECLMVTEDDVTNLKMTTDHLTAQAQQQLKAAERYMKRLEYQLSKLEDLQDLYTVQQKLRDGMKTMAQAYVTSSGKERDTALNSVKAGYRESTEDMCTIEIKLEKMMGTFHFQMKGIQGFARLCAGDVFEITIKHSTQKWKSRGRVLKNGQQTWDSPHATFKALIGEVLFIKASEVKGLGKTVLLGNKFCETRELFSAHPQIMTVNLNPSGSLKLNVVITWNPLDGSIDEVMRLQMPATMVNQGGCEIVTPNATPVPSRGTPLRPFYSRNHLQKYPSQDCLSYTTPPPPLTELSDSNRCVDDLDNSAKEMRKSSIVAPPVPLGRVSSLECCSVEVVETDHEESSESVGVLEAVHSLSSCLEDIQGQYPELQSLEHLVSQLAQILRRSRRGSHSSDISTSIESVLECFDFLNTETDDDEDDEWVQNRLPNDDSVGEHDLTGKTSDSGVGSLTHHTSLEQANGDASSTRSKSPCSGMDQLDLVLVIHLSYCQHLAELLGTFGPLKCKEVYALGKLKKQTPILETLIRLLKSSKEERKDISGVEELKEDSEMQLIWGHCSDQKYLLCIPASQMLSNLQELCLPQLHDKPSTFVASVAKLLITRILDSSRFDSEALVTIYQFKTYVQSVTDFDFEKHVEALSEEVHVNEVLQSYDVPAIIETLSLMTSALPSPHCLRTSSQLLLVPHQNIQSAVQKFLEKCNSSSTLRKTVLNVFIEALESDSSLVRQCACLALVHLKASDCINELAYLYQSDECTSVRNAAKEALLTFGSEGRRAVEQSQLASHGFHGLGLK